MKKFTSGLLTGSLIGLVGVAWAISDTKTRRRMARQGKRAMHKANEVFENVQDMF